jgi:TATA-box binding protein (TBP) (component of TFIID and TFIIIB)
MNRELFKIKVLNDIYCQLLPDDITINTMTIICDTNIEFNIKNISSYIDTSFIHKKKVKKIKKNKKSFFNQVTLCVMVESKKEKPVNLKLFSNGSMQMTGCKTIDNALDTLEKMFSELRKVKGVLDKNSLKIVDKPFCDNIEFLNYGGIKNIRVEMIVSKFTYPCKINRPLLFELLQIEHIECKYDPELHASVDLKILFDEKKISVFIFEKGSIVITGARNCKQVEHAYNFINTFLLKNHKVISKKNLGQNDIEKYLEV